MELEGRIITISIIQSTIFYRYIGGHYSIRNYRCIQYSVAITCFYPDKLGNQVVCVYNITSSSPCVYYIISRTQSLTSH